MLLHNISNVYVSPLVASAPPLIGGTRSFSSVERFKYLSLYLYIGLFLYRDIFSICQRLNETYYRLHKFFLYCKNHHFSYNT